MKEKDCYIWLNSIQGVGHKTIEKILNYFGALLPLWTSPNNEIYKIPHLQKHIADKIIEHRDIKFVENYKQKMKKKNVISIIKEEESYPISLRNTYDPPYILNLIGSITKKDQTALAIVGSRRATPYGKNIAYKFAKDLVKYGITVVSGMAYGIDSAAHKGALDGGGRTIAVLGCGVDICYPKSNYKLMKDIINNGAIVSEYPLGTQPTPGNFPQRNRIISGLSKAVLVVEAGLKSGSLITVDYALEQGKDVFAVPGNINSNFSKGTNKLIKEGAKPVTCIEDILEEFNISNKISDNNTDIELSDLEKKIFKVIEDKQPIHMDLIGAILHLNPSDINSIITILEIKGIIEQLPGKIIITK
ncbi:MAG: processing protein [Candidatus Petromonas sp.]|nr:processing protein [Candidatus Petromonas sp.]